MQVVKRDGTLQDFNPNKIRLAILKAFDSCCPLEDTEVIDNMISEMYLIAAEAAYMKDNASNINSTKYLNELQSARGASKTDGTLQNIKEEWYKELVGNGHRFVCLKRWGDGFEGRPAQAAASAIVMTGEYYTERTMEAGAYVMNWPVPSYELKLNDNLVQNAGYEAN